MTTLKEADQIIHKVEDEWHYPIMIAHGWTPKQVTATGLVRHYVYNKGIHCMRIHTGYSCDYWVDVNTQQQGYHSDLEQHLKLMD